MKLNLKLPGRTTHEGGPASTINPELELRRTVMSCLLWEKGYYEDGQDIAARIAALIPKIAPQIVADIAVAARVEAKLRHVPLLLVREMARLSSHKHLVAKTLAQVIQRPDELTEFVAIYWKDKRQPLSSQVKKGLAAAFTGFNEYSLAKYNKAGAVKLRDVLFLCHAKPLDDKQAAIWKRLVDGNLAVPDTWEVALSAGGNKREIWERLLSEKKLGALALLRNLRNMTEAAVPASTIGAALSEMKTDRVLPYRFIAAAKHAPDMEPHLELAMLQSLKEAEKLTGRTVLLVDVSGSMDSPLSSKSELTYLDAACGLAMLAREICEDVRIVTFSDHGIIIPPRRGFALRDAIIRSQPHHGTLLGTTVTAVNKAEIYDRLIIITDEQTADRVPAPKGKGYIINVASNQNGIGYSEYVKINGWSENCVRFIQELEKSNVAR